MFRLPHRLPLVCTNGAHVEVHLFFKLNLVFFVTGFVNNHPYLCSLLRGNTMNSRRLIVDTVYNCIDISFIRTVGYSGDRFCGLVVRALGYRSEGAGSIPGTTRKKSSGSGTGSTQPREYN
jgi:hypothetical protein